MLGRGKAHINGHKHWINEPSKSTLLHPRSDSSSQYLVSHRNRGSHQHNRQTLLAMAACTAQRCQQCPGGLFAYDSVPPRSPALELIVQSPGHRCAVAPPFLWHLYTHVRHPFMQGTALLLDHQHKNSRIHQAHTAHADPCPSSCLNLPAGGAARHREA